MEDTFIKIAKDDKQTGKSETIYQMDGVEQTLLNTFLEGRNNALLFAKGNVGADGKPTIFDPGTGRPIYINDGLIPQAEAFASKTVYNKLTMAHLRDALAKLNAKARKPTGNKYLFLCDENFWNDVNEILEDRILNTHVDATFLWSMKANDYVSVGARGFDTYRFAGNEISFKVDRNLTREFGSKGKGFALALDVTGDSKQPPVGMFALKGKDIISNYMVGPGGLNGLSSGEVSTPVAGAKRILWGYSSLALFNPYRAHIFRQM